MVFDIQRYSIHDGEGIRTLVFFKGCPLRCQWCSNPESQDFDAEVMYDPDVCHDFGDCMEMAPEAIFRKNGRGIVIDRSNLEAPDLLRTVCASRALTVSGTSITVEELIEEITKDLPFYRDGGGVTLSGGEPLAQDSVLTDLLTALNRREIGVNVETSLHVSWKQVERCVGKVDTFLADLKHVDPLKFKEHTGGDAGLVMQNLERLVEDGSHVILRIPVIPDFNHSQSDMEMILDYAGTLQGVEEVHYLPYHSLGKRKYQMLDRAYLYEGFPVVTDSELEPYLRYARLKGFKTKIGG
jgi:pyruvate formate lyase activating enzyme